MGTERCYLEVLFGKLHGRAYRLSLAADEEISDADLWIS